VRSVAGLLATLNLERRFELCIRHDSAMRDNGST